MNWTWVALNLQPHPIYILSMISQFKIYSCKMFSATYMFAQLKFRPYIVTNLSSVGKDEALSTFRAFHPAMETPLNTQLRMITTSSVAFTHHMKNTLIPDVSILPAIRG